ncbi:MAG TPA: PIG-L deacetylase family protein [Polyangiales bacterium]|nr:PIG-L deacetylase family protein [Polyangiales bacterium]
MVLPVRLANEAPRILCLGAHSDDIEIGCGGTILRLLAEYPGAQVHWVVFASNPAREREARESAASFAPTATVIVHAFRESFFPAQWSEIKDALGAVRAAVEPDLVLSHRLEDMHQDHRVLAELTWNSFRNHLIWQYEIAKYEGDLGRPNLYVPLTRAIADRKVELLHQHFPTQRSRTWFSADTFHGLMSLRAIECNAPEGRAEAFHVRKIVV